MVQGGERTLRQQKEIFQKRRMVFLGSEIKKDGTDWKEACWNRFIAREKIELIDVLDNNTCGVLLSRLTIRSSW